LRLGASKQYFSKSSSERLKIVAPSELSFAPRRPDAELLSGLLYPLSCLALGVVLGSCVGAALAPQLLRAENAGVYAIIRQSAEMMGGHRAQRPAAVPRLRLPHLSLRQPRGRVRVMQARLPAERYGTQGRFGERRHALLAKGEPPSAREPPACLSCDGMPYRSPIEAIFNDKTLRAGDTVIMSMGALVFRGARHLPYTATDFVDFRKTSLLTRKERLLIDDDLGLTRGAEAMRRFEAKARLARAAPQLARSGAMRAYLPATPAVR